MRTVVMCFSILQVPKCSNHNLTNFWQKSFHSLDRTYRYNSGFALIGSKLNSVEGGYSRRWIRRPISTKPDGSKKTTQNGQPTAIRHEILDERVSKSATLNVTKKEVNEFQKIQYCDILHKVADYKDLAKQVTPIVFDLETSGFSRDKDRIIEIGCQDLHGGENSTFHTLVNPGCYVANSHVHGITTHMVCRPDVPRMEELIPILLQYVWSRQKPGGYVLFVAHNARVFDVPFLIKEFNRCSFDIPSNWLFLDTMPLARKFLKSEGSKMPLKSKLEDLREKFEIPKVGSAHRAMSDVRTLSSVFQRLTFGLKLSMSDLVLESFTASDLSSSPKKKSST